MRLNLEIKNRKLLPENKKTAILKKFIIYCNLSRFTSPKSRFEKLFQLLIQGHINKDEFWEILPNLTNSIDSMYRNTDPLLKWSRNQLQGINPKAENIDLKKILREGVSSMQKTASNKNIRLIFSTDITPIHILRNPHHLGIILQNLLHNAIKFSMENLATFIDCFVDNNGLPKVLIRNTGIGISSTAIDNVNSNQMIISQRGTTGEQKMGLRLLIYKEYCNANKIEMILKPIDQGGSEVLSIFRA